MKRRGGGPFDRGFSSEKGKVVRRLGASTGWGVGPGHICRRAKFQRNRTIRHRVIAIQLTRDDRRSPSCMFEGSISHVGRHHFRPIHQIW